MLSITLQRYKFLSKSQPFASCMFYTYSCRLPYKGTNFSANHNQSEMMRQRKTVVDYLTKVQISQQITTVSSFFVSSTCCRLPYKGTNFSANHNANDRPHPLFWLSITLQRYKFLSKSQLKLSIFIDFVVVDYLTKVQISQQITTFVHASLLDALLSITLQRYKFLSKSQRNSTQSYNQLCCRLPYKGTNFSANHNQVLLSVFVTFVVDYLTKVQISQQITTGSSEDETV